VIATILPSIDVYCFGRDAKQNISRSHRCDFSYFKPVRSKRSTCEIDLNKLNNKQLNKDEKKG
jgi:hypothetical protein